MKPVTVSAIVGLIGCVSTLQIPSAAIAGNKETVLYAFGGPPDGASPTNLVGVDGQLFGTTVDGGARCKKDGGCGTVFSLNPATGAETVVRSFGTHGYLPFGNMIEIKGKLYGTTGRGGNAGGGSVFVLDPKTGTRKTLYSFCSQQYCTDGQYPGVGLIEVKDTLYGTTSEGGAAGVGTVFALDPDTGSEKVLYSFCSQQNCADGDEPTASLIDVKGMLYGLTYTGGAGENCIYGSDQRCGTVFAVDPETGAETVLHSFGDSATDGAYPYARMIDVNGLLYGTTNEGGASGDGTVFSVDPRSGKEKAVYNFSGPDGAYPFGGVTDVDGTLYGTTQQGGAYEYGTVFALDPKSGAETVLYSFCSQQGCTDGYWPSYSLIEMNGTLYGTTGLGGAFKYGEVFAITP